VAPAKAVYIPILVLKILQPPGWYSNLYQLKTQPQGGLGAASNYGISFGTRHQSQDAVKVLFISGDLIQGHHAQTFQQPAIFMIAWTPLGRSLC
jgi:hypothetical protein